LQQGLNLQQKRPLLQLLQTWAAFQKESCMQGQQMAQCSVMSIKFLWQRGRLRVLWRKRFAKRGMELRSSNAL